MASEYDVFVSYTQRDGEIAADLASRLHDAGITCFLADRSILAAAEWEPAIRTAIWQCRRMLLLITPRSKDSLWVAAEAGAAWVLEKEMIPVLMFVDPPELFDPIRKFQARTVETPQQMDALVRELRSWAAASRAHQETGSPNEPRVSLATPRGAGEGHEDFNSPDQWDRLVKVGQWTRDPTSGAVTGAGMYRYLLSDQRYGPKAFTIQCRLQFLRLLPENSVNAVNAGIVLGWDTPTELPGYLHLMFSGTRLLLEQIGRRGGDEYHDFRHIDEGVPFELREGRIHDFTVAAHPDSITVTCDGEHVYTVRPPRGTLVGRVGLRPWRSHLRCHRFIVSTR
ncbi:MAG TPA: toll/interleukin-1 receptor domain-containing protein [Longimicrobium sp.]|nr:toll/interleukin-1 receptor domain-containing protein [Longimicrobium sp.]